MLPIIKSTINNSIYKAPEDGALVYNYAPFKNLREDNKELQALQINAVTANIDVNSSIELETEESYDRSVNLLINDRVNAPKIVNSRFYLDSSMSYRIADRKGNLDTNIYDSDNFKIDTNLTKIVNSIITLDFLGIRDGGQMPVGNYTFYFKLADSDGNETDFVSESGKVVCHIGSIKDPMAIRGGQGDENSGKIIEFKLNNLDLSYDFINIYYTKSGLTTQAFKIEDKFKISPIGGTRSSLVAITGYESHLPIDIAEINLDYVNFDKVGTIANSQNISFIGNTRRNYDVYSTLEKLSLFVTPQLVNTYGIGNINEKYIENFEDAKKGTKLNNHQVYEYYNAENTYYRLGYWDDEIYRFGIVYILNDYTLSPVFNIRGVKTLTYDTTFVNFGITDKLETDEYNNISGSPNTNPENTKGILKIDYTALDPTTNGNISVFRGDGMIKPIAFQFNFGEEALNGDAYGTMLGLKALTKGFFIVRQKRIPTIVAQGISLGTSSKTFTPTVKGKYPDYGDGVFLGESFLTPGMKVGENNEEVKLGRSIFPISTAVNLNALLCPEAALRTDIYNNLFNSSEFILRRTKYQTGGFFLPIDNTTKNRWYLGNLTKAATPSTKNLKSSIILVEPGIGKISINDTKFCSKAGSEIEAWQTLDPIFGDIDEVIDAEAGEGQTAYAQALVNDILLSKSTTKLRGEFNTFLGVKADEELEVHQPYNIFQKDYDFDFNWQYYFQTRYNNDSPYMAISDRIPWTSIRESTSPIYRGDCYISTYTHRMNWNFIDPELPTNDTIVDSHTWYKNYRVKTLKIDTNGLNTIENSNGTVLYRKILDLFTYNSNDAVNGSLVTEESENFLDNSEKYGTYGASKINRPDVNSVGLGHWVTFKICSNSNLALRDVDFSRSAEEAVHRMKRSFYPLQDSNPENKLPESSVINPGISKSLSEKYYLEIPDVPFIKSSFNTRIYYSNIMQESVFKNGNRVFIGKNFQDFTNEYGAIVKLVEWYGHLVAVMEHGILAIPVNEKALIKNESGQNIYINSDNVLTKNPKVLSQTFGSLYPDSIIKTDRYIYGIDTVGKKIWRTNGDVFEVISNFRIQKFLNDNINLPATNLVSNSSQRYVKSHFNAFKKDILFVYKVGDTSWNLCWNEDKERWYTKYTWFPAFSENINNIFYTFANESVHAGKGEALYKHGFAGASEEVTDILPTKWYGEQHPFEFEFVVIGVPGVQKIFNNLKIVSNKTQPDSFYYEIVGEDFAWNDKKDDIYLFRDDDDFLDYLKANPTVKKIPYIIAQDSFNRDRSLETSLRDCTIIENNKTKEKLVNLYQKGNTIKANGRLKGNMDYVEDSWDIQIQPLTFKYAYLLPDGTLALSDNSEMKVRDKYLKVRVKYDGTQYAIITALKTLFTISYA